MKAGRTQLKDREREEVKEPVSEERRRKGLGEGGESLVRQSKWVVILSVRKSMSLKQN